MVISRYIKKIKRIEHNSDKRIFYFSLSESKGNTDIASILTQPYSFFVEKNTDSEVEDKFLNIIETDKPDLFLSLTTASCYNDNIAHLLMEHMNKRFHLSKLKDCAIKTCMHEAIMNAVIHGNLCINSNFQTINGLYNYQTEISKRLNMALYKLKRVNIMAWNKDDHLQIAVSDRGNGFSIANFKEDYISPNGRGLMLIIRLSDSMWVGKDRRTLFMAFNHA